MKRTGKIARLPYDTRQKLNIRLLDNEPGDPLVAWLNAQPQVQIVLREQFDGHPITQQNLSEWRTGGFAVWELRQEVYGDALEAEETSDELDAVTNSGLVDKLCTVLAGRYASLLVHWDGEVTPALTQKLRALHILCRDLTTLRRWAKGKEEGRMKNEQGKRPRTSNRSKRVAPDQTTFPPNPVATTPTGVATACCHIQPSTPEKTSEPAPSPILNSSLCRPHSLIKSDPVAPNRTNFPTNSEPSTPADVATSCRHPEPAFKPVAELADAYRNAILEVVRSKTAPGQPALAVLADWDEQALTAQLSHFPLPKIMGASGGI